VTSEIKIQKMIRIKKMKVKKRVIRKRKKDVPWFPKKLLKL
jgi:hypothetical protein